MEKKIFSSDQERQILKALDEIDTDLGLDRFDDEKALQRILQTHIADEKSKRSKRELDWLRIWGLRQLSQFGQALASPVYVIASFVVILSLVTLTVFQAQQMSTQKSVTVLNVPRSLSTEESEESSKGFIQARSVQDALRTLEKSLDLPSFEVASEDPITLRSNIIESALKGGLQVLIVSEGDSPTLIVFGLEQSSSSQVPFRALVGAPLQISGNVRVKVVDK
jgi:hypothetical protein